MEHSETRLFPALDIVPLILRLKNEVTHIPGCSRADGNDSGLSHEQLLVPGLHFGNHRLRDLSSPNGKGCTLHGCSTGSGTF